MIYDLLLPAMLLVVSPKNKSIRGKSYHKTPPTLIIGWGRDKVRIGKPGRLVVKEQRNSVNRAVTVLGDVNFGDILLLGLRVVKFFAVNKHHDVRILLDSAGLTKVGKLRNMTGQWFSTARLNWLRQMTGILSSRANPFRFREISETSWTRFSVLPPLINCK